MIRLIRNLWRRTRWARRRIRERIYALERGCSGYTGDGDCYYQFTNGYHRYGILAERAAAKKAQAALESIRGSHDGWVSRPESKVITVLPGTYANSAHVPFRMPASYTTSGGGTARKEPIITRGEMRWLTNRRN